MQRSDAALIKELAEAAARVISADKASQLFDQEFAKLINFSCEHAESSPHAQQKLSQQMAEGRIPLGKGAMPDKDTIWNPKNPANSIL